MENRVTVISEEAAFNSWLDDQKANGLVDLKLYPETTSTASKESFYAELNAMNHAFASGRFEEVKDL